MGNLSFVRFSKILLETGDIDPDYIFLREKSAEVGWGHQEIFEWILHKIVIYDSVSEFQVLTGQSTLSSCKYGTERRKHKARAAEYLTAIRQRFLGLNIERFFGRHGQLVFNDIVKIRGCGPWAAWNMMDLVSCCYGMDVDFDTIDFRNTYRAPLMGLLMVGGYPEDIRLLKQRKIYHECMNRVLDMSADINPSTTPHNQDRGININEIETLLCKYHSYAHGHYSVGSDIKHLKSRRLEARV